MKQIDAKYLAMKIEFITDAFVQKCEEEEIQLIVWPVDTKKTNITNEAVPECMVYGERTGTV